MMMKEVKEVAARVQQEEKALRQLCSAAEVGPEQEQGASARSGGMLGGWHAGLMACGLVWRLPPCQHSAPVALASTRG